MPYRQGGEGMEQGFLQLLGNGLLVWAALVGTASVVVHLRVFDRTMPMSRHLLLYMAAIAAVLDLGVVRLIVGDSWGFLLLRLVVFVGVPVLMTQRLYLQIQAQRGGPGSGVAPFGARRRRP